MKKTLLIIAQSFVMNTPTDFHEIVIVAFRFHKLARVLLYCPVWSVIVFAQTLVYWMFITFKVTDLNILTKSNQIIINEWRFFYAFSVFLQ